MPFPIEVATSPIVAAMEAQVEWEADRYAQRIAPRLRVTSWKGFLAPYWHRMGTLYQVAFGRDAEGSKRMEFVVATLEGSAPANPTPLPAMGKLSYLRALHPLAGSPEGSLPALPASLGQEQIEHKALQPSERRIDLSITPIAQRGAFVPEAVALVYRPWHLVTAELDGSTHGLLVDGGAADVVGEATFASLNAEPLPPPARKSCASRPAAARNAEATSASPSTRSPTSVPIATGSSISPAGAGRRCGTPGKSHHPAPGWCRSGVFRSACAAPAARWSSTCPT